MAFYSCTVEENIPSELRLDRYIAEYLKLLTRSQIKVRSLNAILNDKTVKLSRIIKSGDKIELSWKDPEPADLVPEDIFLEIIYENENIAVINKAQGMVVHPGAGNQKGTLANALLFRCINLNAGETFRPGIVHRLDKDTSGVIIVAYNNETLTFLSEQFKNRKVQKIYVAIVCNSIKEKTSGRIETYITRDTHDRKKFMVSQDKGKNAITFYRVIHSWENYSLLLLKPKTGRTHQIRLHLRHIGHPILGDPLYGLKDTRFPNATLMLHAKKLTLFLPKETKASTFKTALPPRFKDIFRKL